MPLIRLDIPERKFFLLGNIFTPQEGYFLHLFLIAMGLSLFFFTTLVGRVWCGWACPQTIYTDIFDSIGRKIQGSKYGRKDAPLLPKIITHLSWILISCIASAAWISYFADPYLMVGSVSDLKQSGLIPGWIGFFAFFAFAMYADIAWIREQFCKYACPYARFQTVMMDAHSINITYDFKRGEPRRTGKVKIGDCTSCNMCLVVCPTGIDIREGTNVGCIACGKCSDACTQTMAKENKKTLIGYSTENQIYTRDSSIKWIRPRTIVYASSLLIVLSALSLLLWQRVPLYLSVLPDRNIPPISLGENIVRNFYEVQMQNLTQTDKVLKFEILRKDLKGNGKILIGGTEEGTVTLPANSNKRYRLFIELQLTKEDVKNKSHSILLKVSDSGDPNFFKTDEVPFLLPEGLAFHENHTKGKIVYAQKP
ncbi:cytochrome c oxidase accessory protein CcoG [Leptospira kobayashii]|uniref:Cytochrome c oxidase accessory protein CcoG n=2 Tax=Leptospira kobayashii TaxID=1917830 RepID=A0ABN6KEM3_9LEPT|nr:cytochrome c oxidase accessory protein CcoG [Leptospira kobayashii]